MKTPREILFERHQSAEPRLDAIRRQVLAEHLKTDAADGNRQRQPSFSLPFVLAKLWQELVWPCRRFWIGVAAVWVVILALALITTAEAPKVAAYKPPAPNPEVLMALREQRNLLDQLLEPVAPPPVSSSPPPGPRSERRIELIIV